jgi:hypothetical protein
MNPGASRASNHHRHLRLVSLVHKFDVVTGPFAYLRLLGNRAEVDASAPSVDLLCAAL